MKLRESTQKGNQGIVDNCTSRSNEVFGNVGGCMNVAVLGQGLGNLKDKGVPLSFKSSHLCLIQPPIYRSHLTIALFQKATTHSTQYAHPVGLQISNSLLLSAFSITYSAFRQTLTQAFCPPSTQSYLLFTNSFFHTHVSDTVI